MGIFSVFFGCRGVVGFKVATSLRPVCEVFRPAWLGVCVSAKKFAHRAENTPKLVFLGLLGELCRGSAVGGAALGEYFRAYRHRGLVSEGRGALHAGKGGVFALHEAFQGRVVGVSEPHVVQFPRVVAGVLCVLAEVLAAGPFDWQC